MINKLPFLIVGLARVLNNGAGFLITLILVRLLNIDNESLGNVQSVLALFSILSLVSDFGFVETIQRQVNLKDPKNVIFSAITLSFGIKLIIVFLLIVLNFFFNFIKLSNPIYFFLLLLFTIFNTLVLVYNGLGKPLLSSIFQITYVSTLLVSLILARKFFANYSDLVILSYLLASIVGSFVIILKLFVDKLIKVKLCFFDKEFWQMCFSNTIFWISFVILTQTDVLFIDYHFGAEIAGFYKSTGQIALFVRVAGLIVTTPFLPFVAKSYTQNKESRDRVLKLLKNMVIVCFTMITMLSVFIFSFSEKILLLIFASPSIASFGKSIFPLLFIVFASQTTQMIMTAFWQGTGKSKNITRISTLQLILYLLVAFFAIKYSLLLFLYLMIIIEVICWVLQIILIKKENSD
jgi:O-antigen/teichoic acid export membrane protein